MEASKTQYELHSAFTVSYISQQFYISNFGSVSQLVPTSFYCQTNLTLMTHDDIIHTIKFLQTAAHANSMQMVMRN